jgi:hypothetical protein
MCERTLLTEKCLMLRARAKITRKWLLVQHIHTTEEKIQFLGPYNNRQIFIWRRGGTILSPFGGQAWEVPAPGMEECTGARRQTEWRNESLGPSPASRGDAALHAVRTACTKFTMCRVHRNYCYKKARRPEAMRKESTAARRLDIHWT